MVKRKVAVALSIFSTLFAGAWWLNSDQKNTEQYSNYNNSSIVLIGSNQQTGENIVQPFKPREYIRIVVAKKEKEEVEPT